MARWRLRTPHYLNVAGTSIVFKETDQNTGKTANKTFEVPLYLDPKDAGDCNHPGMIVVAQGRVNPPDIEFFGPPTPDMDPLDEEAEKISAAAAKGWDQPVDGGDGSYAEKVLRSLESQIVELGKGQSHSLAGVSKDAFELMQQQVQQLMQQNTELIKQLSSKDRRV